MSSVYLCGFMGCGKSRIGRMLSATTGMPLVDLDAVIVEKEGMSIPDIFAQYGEPHFRSLEAKYIRELSDNYVVATGGGALINDSTAEYAKKSGLTVYINTSFEVCYNRIKNDKNRPLVVKNTKEQLEQLYNTRAPIYRRNSMCMVNGDTKDYIICGEIAKLLAYYEKHGTIGSTAKANDFSDIKLIGKTQHLRLLDILESRTSVIEYVMICGENAEDSLLNIAGPFLIRKEKTSSWLGTVSGDPKPVKYIFRADKAIFDHLRSCEAFFINNGDDIIHTDFGINDIAFRDDKGEALFFTTTHEGTATISTAIKDKI